jgi:hypothetical protein
VRQVPAGQKLAIRPFPAAGLSGGAWSLPVTNLKGLVSRSPSDIFAIVFRGIEWGVLSVIILHRVSIGEERQ